MSRLTIYDIGALRKGVAATPEGIASDDIGRFILERVPRVLDDDLPECEDQLCEALDQCESCENWFASGVESIGATGPMCPGCRGADTSDEDNAGYNRTVREGLKL